MLASLLSVDENELSRALCLRVIAARGELMEKSHTVPEALYGRDAFAKVSFDRYVTNDIMTSLHHYITLHTFNMFRV